jgi:predicted nuclease with TOPRIM domain
VVVGSFLSESEAKEIAYLLNEYERAACEEEERRGKWLQKMRAEYTDELKRREKEYSAMLQRFNEAYQENIRLMEGWCVKERRRIEELPQQDSGPSPS